MKVGMSPPKEPNAQAELWREPDIARAITAPEVHRSLEIILGSGYMIYPHRHMHTCSAITGQEWHQDPSIFPIRTPRPRQVLAMYYPGDVTLDDGATQLLP